MTENDLTVLQRSLLVADSCVIDRVSFILVRDGIPRERLERAIGLDKEYPYFAQPGRSIASIQVDVADFLGVSVEWLLTGHGRSERIKPNEKTSGAFLGSVMVSGNQAHTINVNNYAERG